jgi:hypothetical protein
MNSSMVARALLLAHRIMGMIVMTKDGIDWLNMVHPICNVSRRDFVDTDRGSKKLVDAIALEVDEPESSVCY